MYLNLFGFAAVTVFNYYRIDYQLQYDKNDKSYKNYGNNNNFVNISLVSYVLSFIGFLLLEMDIPNLYGKENWSIISMIKSGAFIFVAITFFLAFAFFPILQKINSKNVRFL